ncbi:hypothetical protein vseg_016420 [Gypsophila vaccaria]
MQVTEFTALNFPVKILNDVNNHRNNSNKHCTKSLPSSSSSSVQLPSISYESKKLSNSQTLDTSLMSSAAASCALTQSNAVGIIGGVSVLSTLIFLEKLVLWSSRNGQGGVPFIVCSDPSLRQGACAENMKSKRVFLEEGGARCIVMPCHMSHALYGEISLGCELPFLHVARCVARELEQARFRPLEVGCGVKVGLIANEATLLAGFYQEELKLQGFEVALPDRATIDHIVNPAMECVKQKDVIGARNLLRIAIQGLLVRAVNTVILASDELQCLLPHDDPLLKYCVDPLDSLARSAVMWANADAKSTQETTIIS